MFILIVTEKVYHKLSANIFS